MDALARLKSARQAIHSGLQVKRKNARQQIDDAGDDEALKYVVHTLSAMSLEFMNYPECTLQSKHTIFYFATIPTTPNKNVKTPSTAVHIVHVTDLTDHVNHPTLSRHAGMSAMVIARLQLMFFQRMVSEFKTPVAIAEDGKEPAAPSPALPTSLSSTSSLPSISE